MDCQSPVRASLGQFGTVDVTTRAASETRDGAEDAAPTGPVLRLRILATTDLHACLLPWDYASDRAMPGTGLLALAPVIAAARAEVPNCLLLDNGDMLQGTAMGDLAAADRVAGRPRPDPIITVMNDLGYDAGTLGNHDFSHGLPHLRAALATAAFPVVTANARATPALAPTHVLLDRWMTDEHGARHRLRIGITGVLPPQTALWERGTLQDAVTLDDMRDAARVEVGALRAEGADVVILLAHTGIGPAEAEPGMENAALVLAGLPGVDALVMGHTHQVFPAPSVAAMPGVDPDRGCLAGVPAVMAGAHGSHLGVIDLSLRQDGGRWRVTGRAATCRPAQAEVLPGPIPAEVATAHRRTLDWVRHPIAHADRMMSTHFALIAPSPALRLVARAKARHVARALAGGPWAGLPVLASVAPFRAGGRGGPSNYSVIAPGEVQLRHVLDLYPHANTITALLLTGAQVSDWLERAVSLFHRIAPGAVDQSLIDRDAAPFNFDLIEGLAFDIDLSAPARHDARGRLVAPEARRIRALTFRGAAVRPTDRFIVATNCYRANGGAGFPGTGPTPPVLDDRTPVREVLRRHLEEQGTTLPPASGGWGFVPMPDTSVTFLTAPEARDHLDDLPAPGPEPLDLTPEGFLRFRLRLG